MWMSALGFGVKDQLVFGPNDVNCSIIYTDASVLAWRIPWMEELDGLQSMGSQRVRHDWVTNTHLYWWRIANNLNIHHPKHTTLGYCVNGVHLALLAFKNSKHLLWGITDWKNICNGGKKNRLLNNICCCCSAQLCLILCNPMYCSPPGSSVNGILTIWLQLIIRNEIRGGKKRLCICLLMVGPFPVNNGIIINLIIFRMLFFPVFFFPVNMRFSCIGEGKSCYKYKDILDGFLCSLKYDKHFYVLFLPPL